MLQFNCIFIWSHVGIPGEPGRIGLPGTSGHPGSKGMKGDDGGIGGSGLPGSGSVRCCQVNKPLKNFFSLEDPD